MGKNYITKTFICREKKRLYVGVLNEDKLKFSQPSISVKFKPQIEPEKKDIW